MGLLYSEERLYEMSITDVHKLPMFIILHEKFFVIVVGS